MLFFNKKKEKHYLDDFTDKEIVDWINGKKNKTIDRIIQDYEDFQSGKTTNDTFIGFKERTYGIFNMLESDELIDELEKYIDTGIKSSKYREHIIAILETNAIN